ncbi:hypothetical protein [Prauserella flavalba]|uniref:hypothetical protein n=1 Tax=Prauserella flavalba TaxID=1477506 RepID=UPI000D759DF5|nr:hypothetical protein [Prauserella flavalba]
MTATPEGLSDRATVLAQYPPAAEQLDLAEIADFVVAEPAHRRVAQVRAEARRSGRVLLEPLAGFGGVKQHTDALTVLRDKGTADILPTQVDSQTRNLKFDEVATMLAEHGDGPLPLNGYPIVNHPLTVTRDLVSTVDRPIELRIGSTDPRLAAEMAFAAGISSITAGPLYYLVHYSSAVTVEQSVANWGYVFSLASWYARQGAPVGLQVHGLGNSTPFPASLLGAGAVLECLIAAARGCRHFAVDSRLMGNLRQDVASLRAIRDAVEHYLAQAGVDDAVVTMVRKTWAGRYPADEARAFGLISYTAVSGMLSGADEFISNSVQEGVGIPDPEANAASLRAIRHVVDLLGPQPELTREDEGVEREYALITAELHAIVDAVLDLGEGNPGRGSARALELGVLDVPFAASRTCRGEVVTARDSEGAVRFVDFGRLPIPDWCRKFHSDAMERRLARTAKSVYDVVVSDIFSISNGPLVEVAE